MGMKTRDPGRKTKAEVFVRDSFTCCYCGRKTIPSDVLKLLSHRFGDDFGYQKNWNNPPTHRAYWDISASLDHVVAVSVGSDWESVANLATTCYRCQEQKNNRPLNSLGWRLKRVKSDWDGLTNHTKPCGTHSVRRQAITAPGSWHSMQLGNRRVRDRARSREARASVPYFRERSR
jgi:5-methylcytosine-specific restriction endonuclease McrA